MEDEQPGQAEEEEEELLAPGSQQPQSLTFQHLRDGSGGEQDLKRAVTMNLHGKSLASIAALDECPNLRTLDLSFNLITNIEGMSALSKLKELKLYDNRIASLAGLQGLSSLHTLDISSNKLASLEGLKGLRGLRVLKASGNGLCSLNSLGRWASGLEALDISFNKLQDSRRERGTARGCPSNVLAMTEAVNFSHVKQH
ncbi:hypothetical protein DUNSADRAFT_16772 [Dunaliella salina]|uniref:Uncharacterized protein n=1 Tax=Dunaliella salina TaxID=3046 RepID=A0ABQ7G2W8_DUNSA|nr:hypothetical protein DUNSADRAFT_16772 [Dunaliella salina]|eukprot:KAF5828949.1 hypothetical protein DUNSADRAFT_16772 [Dunaliella salina]